MSSVLPACAPERALTVDELADYLHVHRRTVIRLVERGEIPALRLGRIYRFDPERIRALFDGSTGEG